MLRQRPAERHTVKKFFCKGADGFGKSGNETSRPGRRQKIQDAQELDAKCTGNPRQGQKGTRKGKTHVKRGKLYRLPRFYERR